MSTRCASEGGCNLKLKLGNGWYNVKEQRIQWWASLVTRCIQNACNSHTLEFWISILCVILKLTKVMVIFSCPKPGTESSLDAEAMCIVGQEHLASWLRDSRSKSRQNSLKCNRTWQRNGRSPKTRHSSVENLTSWQKLSKQGHNFGKKWLPTKLENLPNFSSTQCTTDDST